MIFKLQNYIWPDGAYINNGYINVINFAKKRYWIEISEQKTHKTQKVEKLISQNDR